jgi:anti-anti-sigma regulatory factor
VPDGEVLRHHPSHRQTHHLRWREAQRAQKPGCVVGEIGEFEFPSDRRRAPMAAKFHSAVHRRAEVTYLKLGGVIDEDNDLGALGDQVGPGPLIVDLSEIERINSCGVRDWVNWLGRVDKAKSPIVLVECSPSIVAQVNLVNNFTGVGVVKSFYAPYFCPSCDREKVLLIETRDAVGRSPFVAPTCRCDECDGPMDFDDMEESYFAFLQHASKLAADPRIDEVLSEFSPSDGAPKLRARASGSITTPAQAAPVSSLPSVPSLPGGRKTGTSPATPTPTGPGGSGGSIASGGTGAGGVPFGDGIVGGASGRFAAVSAATH